MSKDLLAAELISKFLLNKLTTNEKVQLKEWVHASEENRSKFIELTNLNYLIDKARQFLSIDEEVQQKSVN